jgi:hypothetical protein
MALGLRVLRLMTSFRVRIGMTTGSGWLLEKLLRLIRLLLCRLAIAKKCTLKCFLRTLTVTAL